MSEYNRHKWAMEWMHGGGRDPNGRGLDEEIRIGKEDWMERQRVAQGGRIGLQSGQLVQPGPGRQGYEGNPRKLRVELTADQTVEFRKRVEKLATFNDQPKPNWKKYPNLGYDYDNITEHNMATDAKRNLLKGRKPQELKFLNKADQDLIKSKFTLPENVKEWNFKEYKYGLSQTTPKGENYKLGQSVRNYIVNKHHFNYGFSDFGNRNYHLFQMGRASKKYPKLYEPIYQNKKVIGFIDNTPTGKGEKYYHADYKKGKTILQHPDAKKLGNIREVIEKADKNFVETADNIFSKHGYKNISEVMDDFQKIKGRPDIPSGIAQHHPFGTKEAGKTVLLTRDANIFAENVKRAVKRKVNPISIEEADKLLKEKGIPYEIDGKKLGKWGISPEKQLKDWEKGLERKFGTGKLLQEFPDIKKVPKATKIPPSYGVGSTFAGVADDFLKTKTAKTIGKGIGRGARFLASDWVWPEILFAGLEYKNRKQKGQSTERARSEILKMASLGLYDQQGTEKDIIKQAKMLGYEENDIQALDNFMKINKLDEEIQKKLGLIEAMELGAVEQGVYGKAEEMEKIQIGAEGGAQALRDEVAEMEKTKESLTGFYFGALERAGDKDTGYGGEIFSKSLKSLSDTEFNASLEDRMKRVDPYAGGVGNWLQNRIFNVEAWKAGEYGEQWNPYLAEQERIDAMNPQELREFNIERGVLPIGPTYDTDTQWNPDARYLDEEDNVVEGGYEPRKMEGLYETMGYMYPKAEGGIASLKKK
jgi:hypothetical protein